MLVDPLVAPTMKFDSTIEHQIFNIDIDGKLTKSNNGVTKRDDLVKYDAQTSKGDKSN